MNRTGAVVTAALSAQVAVSAVQQGLPSIAPALQSALHLGMPVVGVLLGAVNAAAAVTVWAWGSSAAPSTGSPRTTIHPVARYPRLGVLYAHRPR